MLKESCQEIFKFPVLVHTSQQPPLYNPRVNYGSNGSSGKKGKNDHLPSEESQRKKVHTVSLVKNWCYR